jgi:hypothetical protein
MANTYTIRSTEDLKALFPELPKNDAFKRKLDEVFNMGYVFEVEIAGNKKCFTSKSGKQYKARICYQDKCTYIKKTSIVEGSVTMDFYESNKDIFVKIATEPTGTLKIGNEMPKNTYRASYERTENTDWIELAKCIGKLLKSQLVEVSHCSKCGGSGIIPEFMHYADGVCFECLGIGKWMVVSN